MKTTIEEFEKQKQKSIELLKKTEDFLYEGKKLEIEIEKKMFDKIEKSLRDIKNEKLKVALIGGFSEGKTSIAAAWLEKYDKSSMKISQQESSNEVKVYDVDNEVVLIDTPGLFGFKETENKEKYKEITKKYVSEAHIILYVMNSTNPIKESHQEDLKWLFRTLNLLQRTVFVLSRFDEVADVEDKEEYESKLKIKKENVIERLTDTINLTSEEKEKILIVGISANPFDKGIEDYWLKNIEKYKKLSKIESLQKATSETVEKNKGISEIVLETNRTIVKDIMEREVPKQLKRNEELYKSIEEIGKINNKLGKDLEKIGNKIIDTKIKIKEFILDYFSILIKENEGTSIETFNEFYQSEIGEDGIIIIEKIRNEFERRIKTIVNDINSTKLELDAEIKDYKNVMSGLGNGAKFLSNGKFINNITILGFRDGVVNVGKFFGKDIGKFLKFKPWGAVNLAKGLNGMLMGLGIALEVFDQIERQNQIKKFEENKKEITNYFENQRKELIEQIDSEDFEKNFSDYIELKKEQVNSEKQIKELREYKSKFNLWCKTGKEIMDELN